MNNKLLENVLRLSKGSSEIAQRGLVRVGPSLYHAYKVGFHPILMKEGPKVVC